MMTASKVPRPAGPVLAICVWMQQINASGWHAGEVTKEAFQGQGSTPAAQRIQERDC